MKEYKLLSDEEMVTFLQQDGNMRYFALITDRYEKHILKKCLSYVKDEDAAADLCQEVLIKIFLHLKDFRKDAHFKTWLYAIIHHTCVDYLRKRKKNVHDVITEKLADEVWELIEDEDPSEEITIKVLEQLLDEITPDEKLILLMKYKEKHSVKAIQTSLGLSESAVKMRLKRAKEKINKYYNDLRRDKSDYYK